MKSLTKIIEKLQVSNGIDAVFLTGSHGVKESKSYSDIDLVVILKENKNNIYSLYRWIDGIFADIFFFDLADLERINKNINKLDNPTDGVFIDWLKKADIKFDKSGTLSGLKNVIKNSKESPLSNVSKDSFWQKINYNFVTNKRYFESKDPLYLEALEVRLLYSVVEVICGHLSFKNIAWRGEKGAVTYLKNNHPDFYNLFTEYSKSSSLNVRFGLYTQMIDLVFTNEYKKWTENDEIIIKKDFSVVNRDDEAVSYIKSLFN